MLSNADQMLMRLKAVPISALLKHCGIDINIEGMIEFDIKLSFIQGYKLVLNFTKEILFF